MPRMRFISDFDFSPAAHEGRVTVAYKAGHVLSVTRECALVAEEAGAAERCATPETSEPDDAQALVSIPEDWQKLDGNAIRSLAAQMSDLPIRNREDAEVAIRAELDRREAYDVGGG